MKLNSPSLKRTRWGWWLLSAVTTIWLLWITLQPDRTFNGINLIPFSEHSAAFACLMNSSCPYQRRALRFLLINIVGNIVVFMPLGIGLAGTLHQSSRWQTIWRGAAGGFGLSLLIELLQLAIPTRATDVDDLIFNTLGTILGVLFFLFFAPPPKNKIASSKPIK